MMRTIVLAALLTTSLASTAFAKNMYIPVAGRAPGSNGTFWRTDVRIFNPSAVHEVDVTLHFLPQGEDGRNIPGRMFHLGKRETLVLDDVVSIIAPYLTHAVGAIRIDSDNGASFDFIASSRTYTPTGDPERPGTYGQFIPAMAPAEAAQSTAVLHAAVRPDVRTNVGVMNPGLEEVTVRMKVLGVDGQPFLESAALAVPPRSMRQWALTDLVGGLYMDNGVIAVEATAPVFTWGSVIDNHTGDAIFVRGVAPE